MKLLRQVLCMVLLTALIGCGGGDDGSLSRDETPDPQPDTDSIALNLSISSTEASSQSPISVSATLTDNGQLVVGEVVSFSSDLGVLSPLSGTALTNEQGIASILLTAGSEAGAGTITATTQSGGESSVSFSTLGDDDAVVGDINIAVQLVDSNGDDIETITSSRPGLIVATVNGISSQTIVTFSSDVGELPIATAITDENNQATVDILAGGDLGAGTITATIPSGEQGTDFVIIGSTTVQMGSGSPFVEKIADISLSQISAGGTTVVTVDIIDGEGNPFTESIDVNFTSGCASGDSPTATISSPINTSNGSASSTYLAQGCVGDDAITVTADAGGINLSATTTVNVLSADVGSIEFVSAVPENIALIGTGALGGSESSTVQFRVLDTNGDPVNNQEVYFNLNTEVGGIKITPTCETNPAVSACATTNAEGIAQVVINSGSVATSVRVQAVIADSNPVITSQSSLLVVSTGIPDQDSFSLSASVLNPEGWDHDGTEVEVTARLADAFNNPVPDGTAVTFTTEGGSIGDSCTTLNGVCSVIWSSQMPRPDGQKLSSSLCFNADDVNPAVNCATSAQVNNGVVDGGFYGQSFSGRATILAYAIGEESFPDLNGNGRFDESEFVQFSTNTDISGRPYDIDEPFVDHNEDGMYNPSEAGGEDGGELEEFKDFDSLGSFDNADGQYNGVLCAEGNPHCSEEQSVFVNASLVLVMSGSNPFYTVNATSDTPTASVVDPFDSNLYIVGKSTGTVTLTLADLNNQPIPAGSQVTISSTAGSATPSGFTFPSTNYNGGYTFSVTIEGEDQPKSGVLSVGISTPQGVEITTGLINVIIE